MDIVETKIVILTVGDLTESSANSPYTGDYELNDFKIGASLVREASIIVFIDAYNDTYILKNIYGCTGLIIEQDKIPSYQAYCQFTESLNDYEESNNHEVYGNGWESTIS